MSFALSGGMGCASLSAPSAQPPSREVASIQDPATRRRVCVQEILQRILARAPLGTTDTPVDRLELARTRYSTQLKVARWSQFLDSDLDFLRFIRTSSYINRIGSEHGTEMYGLDAYRSWRKAAKELEDIPIGNLKMTSSLIRRTHQTASEGLHGWLRTLFGGVLPGGILPTQGGVYKRRYNISFDHFTRPISEKEYAILQQNEFLAEGKFITLFKTTRGRHGFIAYTPPGEVDAKVEELVTWFEANRTTLEPIELAARFQHRLVSIHPFVDANGRTSRLLMDRILWEYGYPPPILADSSLDLSMTEAQWVDEVKAGISRYVEFDDEMKRAGFDPHATSGPGWPRMMPRTRNNHWPQFVRPLTQHQRVAQALSGEKVIGVGVDSVEFTLLQDGFLYNRMGIPHHYHEGKLWPIPDKTYVAYFQNRRKISESRWSLSTSQRDVFRAHFRLLRDVEKGKVDLKQIEVIPYSKIVELNRGNGGRMELYFEPWQRSVLENAIRIPEGLAPQEVLQRSGWRQTIFEKAFQSKEIAHVIAQYEKVDFDFYEYLQAARSYFPDLVADVEASREKLHRAARALLGAFLEKKQADPEAWSALVRTHPDAQIFESYFSRSRLRFSTYAEAVATTDDSKIVLLRSDGTAPDYLGFRSQNDYKNIFDRLPGASRLRRFIRSYHQAINNPESPEYQKLKNALNSCKVRLESPGFSCLKLLPESLQSELKATDPLIKKIKAYLELFVRYLLNPRYESHSPVEELERDFVEFALHASGSAPDKFGISFSSSPSLYYTGASFAGDTINFAPAGGIEARLYIVEADKNFFDWNHVSQYSSEYEFLGVVPVPRGAIRETLDMGAIRKRAQEARATEPIDPAWAQFGFR